jgi:hypothetical protein
MKNRHNLLLLFIFLAGVIFRVLFLYSGGLTFSYDQGRDAFISRQILDGDFKIQGPPSSTPGLYHGVFYYYLLAPFYLLGSGNPIIPAFALALINGLGIILIYYFCISITGNKILAILASVLYSVSFEQSQYSLWLSNPSYASFTVPLFYFSLWSWIQKKSWAPVMAGISLGLSVQADIFLLYHIPPLLIITLNRNNKINFKGILKFLLGFLIAVSPMLISQVRFGFTAIQGLAGLLLGSTGQIRQFTDTWYFYINLLGRTFADNLFPINVSVGGIIGVMSLILFAKYYWSKPWGQLLVLYVISSAFSAPFGGYATPFLNVGIGLGVYLIFVILLKKLYVYSPILFSLILIGIICANISAIVKYNPKGQTIFALQKDLILRNELSVLDYIYQNQSSNSFTVNTITSPLYINTAWSYLFNWYGLKNYGFLPAWHGHDQIGQLGNNLPKASKDIKDYYLIIDPPEPNFTRFIQPGIEEENGYSILIEETHFGDIIVQKRKGI